MEDDVEELIVLSQKHWLYNFTQVNYPATNREKTERYSLSELHASIHITRIPTNIGAFLRSVIAFPADLNSVESM